MARKRKQKERPFGQRSLIWLSHVLCALIVILIFLTLVQCTIKKPEAPSWRTNITIPLANKTWAMPELIEKIDQENLKTDSLGNPIFFYSDALDTIVIEGSFEIDNFTQTISESLGVIALDPIASTSFAINLSDQFPALPPGVFPDTSFDINSPLPAHGGFSSATISSGSAAFTIENNLGLNLDTVIVIIIDDASSQQVSTYSIPGGIAIGESSVNTIDLAGKTISNQLSSQIHCHAQQQVSFSLSGKSLASSLGMPAGLQVTSATAMTPEISKSFGEAIDLGVVHTIQTATLESGSIVLDIANNTNIPTDLVISIPDIKNGGSSFQISPSISTRQSTRLVYDLSGYTIEPVDQVFPQTIDVDISAVVSSSGIQQVTVDASDNIDVIATIQNINLASATGVIAATTAEFDSLEQEIDIPTGFDQIQLPAAVITLEIENTVNIPGSFTISVDGDQGQHKTITGSIAPGTKANPVVTAITDSNLAAFMNPIPEIFTVSGNAIFGDGITSGTINTDDYVVANVTLHSPLEMIIDSSTLDGEWEEAEMDIDSGVINSLRVANFYAIIENHLPVGISAEILLSGDSATLYSNPEVTLGPIDVPAGILNPDGSVASEVISENILTLDSASVQVLHNDPMWVGQIFTLHGTNGVSVKMSATDYFKLTGYIEIDFNFGEDLWED